MIRWPRIPAHGAVGLYMLGIGVVTLNTLNGRLPALVRSLEPDRSLEPAPPLAPLKNIGRFRLFVPSDYDYADVLPGAKPVDIAPAVELDLYEARMEKLRKRCSREGRSGGIPGSMHTVAIGPAPGFRAGVFAECWSGKMGTDGYIGEDKLVWEKWVCLDNPQARCDIIFEGDD